jgi:hypothetical protein
VRRAHWGTNRSATTPDRIEEFVSAIAGLNELAPGAVRITSLTTPEDDEGKPRSL